MKKLLKELYKDYKPRHFFTLLACIIAGVFVAVINKPANALSTAGVEFIKKHEGYSSCPYRDGTGFSVGYGHNGWQGGCITHKQALILLYDDIRLAESTVDSLVYNGLNENQYAALVSFVYNVGHGNFKKSTMLKLINAGHLDRASMEFSRWVYYKGKRHAGLIKRRQAEKELFMRQ